MDASQYKDYVLTLLFMKYVSDKYAEPDALIEVPEGGGFADMAKLKGDKEIGDKINTIIGRLAEANELKGVIDQADFNDESKLGAGKEMQDRLSKLVAIFEGLDLSANRAEGDDLLGDAYEYLMRHFATESGKSKGQFYTPAEVSRVMAKVIGVGPNTRPAQTIYDPTCGSGSLLLKVADEAPRGITIYGQEMDNATWALARMNMFLHGHPTADLWRGNTLAAPYFKNRDGSLKTFDFAVANPPFSAKAWSSGLNPDHDEFRRFEYGIPPAKNGDYAFLLHLITSLNSKGKGAIILPHGVLFRGNKEADIRRNLIRRGLIKGIIGLHPGHRQGERPWSHWHLHARCEQGLPQGRQQEPTARSGHPQDRGRVHPSDRTAALLAHGAGDGNCRLRQRLQPQHPAPYRFQRAGRPARPRRSPERWHPQPRHRRPQLLVGAFPDDVYLIAAVGWVEAANPRGVVEDKERKIKETPDLTIKRKKYKMDLIPPALVIARYFAAEQAHVEDLQATREAAVRELDEFVEEHSSSVAGEEGLLADVIDDKGSVAKTSVKARLKAIRDEDANDSDEECDALTRCLDLIEAESKAASAVNEARAALDHKVLAHYAVLTEAGIKTLVVEDKWFADIRTAIEHQVQGLTQQLAGRVKELEERYARPLHELKRDVENYSARAEHHLNRMGLSL